MHLKFRNVNDAFRHLVQLFVDKGYYDDHDNTTHRVDVVAKSSRYGPVRMIEEPVLITYSHPRERVLFNAARDCNPFFHMYEALHMLAGRNDVAPLAYYAKKMAEFSDDGITTNGAYGYRWRHASVGDTDFETDHAPDGASGQFGHPNRIDQLDWIVAHLKAKPDSRRAVLQMWNVEDDLLKIGGDACPDGQHAAEDRGVLFFAPCQKCDGTRKLPGSKDVCCNLLVMFSLRSDLSGIEGIEYKWLDMTVTNRSNDMIWGLLGANYVHFSFLQEYMAARLGCEVGVYNHFTNNLHCYDATWKPEEWLACDDGKTEERYHPSNVTAPLVSDPATFERELLLFVERFGGERFRTEAIEVGPHGKEVAVKNEWTEPFLRDVAHPMISAFRAHKVGERSYAAVCLANIKADDWRLAATEWITRRAK